MIHIDEVVEKCLVAIYSFEPHFYSLQAKGWEGTKATIFEKVDDFSYYNETLKNIIREINTHL